MPRSVHSARAAALAALLLSAACTDRSPTEAIPTPRPGEQVRTEIACTVTVATARLTCGAPAPAGGASATIMLGGQGTYVRLESTNLAYDADADVFSVDVSVQNLLSERMGTPDGTTATGVKVFFEEMPTATEGSGEVTVLNADGVGGFTRVNQPYFTYPEILEARGTSAPRPWRFGVPGTVARFGFKVYVVTELPAEQGVLRWQLEHGGTTRGSNLFQGVWGADRDHVYAVAGRSILTFQRDTSVPTPMRHHWTPMAEAPAPLNAIWGTSRFDVYAAGDSGVVMRYDGNRWTVRRAPTAPHQLSGVWSAGGDVWAVGRRQDDPAGDVDGLILHSENAGESWGETLSAGDGKRYLRDVFRAGGSVYAVGYEDPLVSGASPRAGVVLRSDDGGQSWADTLITDLGAVTLHTVWADGPDDVYIGGETTPSGGSRRGLILHTTDGGDTWSASTLNSGYIWSMWRIPGGDLLAVGGGNLLANDGSGWRNLEMGCQGVSAGWRGVWASSPADVFLVASNLSYYRENGCMRETFAGYGFPELTLARANAVSATPAFGVIVGSSTQLNQEDFTPFERAILVTQYDYGEGYSSGWSVEYEGPDSSSLEDVVTQGQNDVVAAGWRQVSGERRALLLRRAGGAWTDVTPAGAQDVPLSAVWSVGSEVYAFGVRAGSPAAIVVLRSTNGGATWTVTAIPYTGSGIPRVTDAWGSSASAIYVSGYAESGATESFTLRFHGAAWTLSVAPGDNGRLTGVWSSGATVVMSGYRAAAGGWAGFVRTSTNGGADWTEAALPATGADGKVEGIWGASPGALYAVGSGGGIYQYDGSDWSAMLGAGGPDFLAVGGTSATNVFAVGTGGAIYHGTR